MNRCSLLLLGLAVALFMGGCVISEQPLSAVSEAKPDARLVGQWRDADRTSEKKRAPDGVEEPEIALVSFDERGMGHIQGVDKEGKIGLEVLRFFVTRAGKDTFLNIQDPSTRSSGYYFYKYRVSEDGKTLQLWSVRQAVLDDAVKAGQLKGKLDVHPPGKSSGFASYTLIQDTSDKVLGFIESKPEATMLDAPWTYERVK